MPILTMKEVEGIMRIQKILDGCNYVDAVEPLDTRNGKITKIKRPPCPQQSEATLAPEKEI